MRILVTGGAGFIGSALTRLLIRDSEHEVLVFDKLTYAGSLGALAPVAANPRYHFVKGDICDSSAVAGVLDGFRPQVIAHLAAESHVDRSIEGPSDFIQTNVVGTFVMLQAALNHYGRLSRAEQAGFRFHHISTDEVFGSLGENGRFSETSPYDPRSPYSASKAGSDHLVRAWGHTYGLPVLITNSSNNYGPYQFPEKLIPRLIVRALAGRRLPVFGDGGNVRDWVFVDDHVQALRLVLEQGRPSETYTIGGDAERRNLDVAEAICRELDRVSPRESGSYAELITLVADRPGHDRRYAVDPAKIRNELGWQPSRTFEQGIAETVHWFLQNRTWWGPLAARADPGLDAAG